MRRVKLAIAVFITYIVLAVGISMLAPGKARSQNPPPTFNVRVSNTPLPVSGNINSTVSGDVNASQKGTWNVGITGTPSVNVANTPTVATGLDGLLGTANNHLAALDGLSFDGGNLKTAPQGTQNVNIVGGSVASAPAPADKGQSMDTTVGAGDHAWLPVNPQLAVSAVSVGTLGESDVDVSLKGPNGITLDLGEFSGNGSRLVTFPQPILVNQVYVGSLNLVFDSWARVSLVGH